MYSVTKFDNHHYLFINEFVGYLPGGSRMNKVVASLLTVGVFTSNEDMMLEDFGRGAGSRWKDIDEHA